MKFKDWLGCSLWRTLCFNFRLLPFRQALRLPVIVFRGSRFAGLKGRCVIEGEVRHAMIKLGQPCVTGWETRATTICLNGTMIFRGKCTIGSGSTVETRAGGVLTLGRNFRITAGCSIFCDLAVTFGDDVLISWETLFMDSDKHFLYDGERLLNAPAPIVIGNHVWICCRSTILKGTCLPDGCAAAAGSILSRSFAECGNCLIGGSGAGQKVLRRGITWSPRMIPESRSPEAGEEGTVSGPAD